ncbi:MAG: heme lyase CcmF/NrfE family subunit [Chloroflexi bacterium]|nr:heme lyase CcmF/NrfE family subunit [Chloroflexota bacterium]MBT7080624.1 heme lyase CcmF/NrfE family subunit [Chloroflexota bacterium]MBT7289987.1 heme lyase CcmF/NrfE family subunit [Chloroflexota bacterium]
MAEIGYIVLILALVSSLYSIVALVIGTRLNHHLLRDSGRRAFLAACALVSIAAAILWYAIFAHDFQFAYVSLYTRTDMSWIYLLSCFWAGHAGSLLFWVWLITVLGAIVVIRSKSEHVKELMPYFSAVVMGTVAFFLILMVFEPSSSPFNINAIVPPEGNGLNPMLDNIGMIIHPPPLFIGYAGFTIPFAFAIAAMITKKLDNQWVKTIRSWTLLSWLMLGMGIVVGMWWAYVELGWGGFWAWDPIENSSLMPWLMGTAFLHTIIIQSRRGMLKIWNIVLIVLTFTLCIFGTYMNRSDLLRSVHNYRLQDLHWYFLPFMAIVLIGSFGLLYYRRRYLKSESQLDSFVSKETSFLLNNILLVGSTLIVFVLSLWFAFSGWFARNMSWLHIEQTTVEPTKYNQIVVPIFLILFLLIGICVFLGWRKTSSKKLIRNFLVPAIVALTVCVLLAILGPREWYALTLFPLCAFVAATHLQAWYREARARHKMKGVNYLRAIGGLILSNRPRYGGMLVHFGIVLLAMGIIGSSVFDTKDLINLPVGSSMTVQGYNLEYEGLSDEQTPSKYIVTATLDVKIGGKLVGKLTPQRRWSTGWEKPVTEVAIRTTLKEDLYIILEEWDDESAWFSVLVNPLVVWMWIGGGVILLGGLIAYWPDQRKQRGTD